jgi:hypothetical protein
MVQIKGTAVMDAMTLVKKRAGEDGFKRLSLGSMKMPKGYFRARFSLPAGIRSTMLTEFLEVEIREPAGGNEESSSRDPKPLSSGGFAEFTNCS